MLKKAQLLDSVKFPADINAFSTDQLKQLVDEVRAEMIDAVSVTGGHFGGRARRCRTHRRLASCF